MAARAKVISTAKAGTSHPCFHKGYSSTYKYGGKDFTIASVSTAGEFSSCAGVSVEAMDTKATCKADQVRPVLLCTKPHCKLQASRRLIARIHLCIPEYKRTSWNQCI